MTVDADGAGWARAFLMGWSAEALATMDPSDRSARDATRSALARGEDAAAGLRTLSQEAPLDTTGLARVQVRLVNQTGAPVRYDDVRLQVGPANPPAEQGSLLSAEHRSTWGLRAGKEPVHVWTPLPLDAAGQVPLEVRFTVSPAVEHTIRYEIDPLGNWGATVSFAPGVAAERVDLRWRAVVLTRRVPSAERPTVYAADDDPARWLTPTRIADAAHPGIARTGRDLVRDDPARTLGEVVRWASKNVSSEPRFLQSYSVDATTVFGGAGTSCTGYATTAAALARAAGLPTRIIAGYLPGQAQQTHFIDESWRGPEWGWLRFEPQGRLPVGDDHVVVVRRMAPEDESMGAMSGSRSAVAGVPLRAVEEATGATRRLRWRAPTDPFPDCEGCDNRADVQAVLVTNPDRMRILFDRARSAWRRAFPAFLEGNPSPRANAIALRTLDDLDAWLPPEE